MKKLEQWPPYFPQKLTSSKEAKDWLIPRETFKVCNGARSLMTRYISCNQMKQITFIWIRLKSIMVHSTNQRSTTWWSDRKLARKGTGLRTLRGTYAEGLIKYLCTGDGHARGLVQALFFLWFPRRYAFLPHIRSLFFFFLQVFVR